MSLLLCIIGIFLGMKFSLLIGFFTVLVSFIIGIVEVRKNGGIANIITIVLAVPFLGFYGYTAIVIKNQVSTIIDSGRERAAENDAYSIINQVSTYYDKESINQNLTTPYVITFNSNGNDKNLTFSQINGKIVSGTVTVVNETTVTCSNLEIQQKNTSYICQSTNNYYVDCTKKQ